MIRSVFSSSVPKLRFWLLKCFLYELMIQIIHKCSFKYFHLQEDVPVCFKSFPLWLKNFNKSLGVVYCFYINKTNLLKKLFEKKEKKCYKSFEKGFSYNFKILIFVFQILTCSDNSLDILNLSLHALAGIMSN